MSNEQKEPQPEKPQTQSMGYWIAIGAAIGAALGAALDSIPIGVAIGITLGIAIATAQTQRNKNK